MERLVEIRSGNTPDCDVYRKTKDTIKWHNNTDTDYRIHFTKECPLDENDFTVGPHETTRPHALKKDVAEGTYFYDIKATSTEKAASTNVAADPNVIVR